MLSHLKKGINTKLMKRLDFFLSLFIIIIIFFFYFVQESFQSDQVHAEQTCEGMPLFT